MKDSTNNSDWEMMGSDIERLQTLIDSLEKMREEENSNTDSTQNTNDMNIVDNTAVESMNNQNTMVNENVN